MAYEVTKEGRKRERVDEKVQLGRGEVKPLVKAVGIGGMAKTVVWWPDR